MHRARSLAYGRGEHYLALGYREQLFRRISGLHHSTGTVGGPDFKWRIDGPIHESSMGLPHVDLLGSAIGCWNPVSRFLMLAG